jgi:hypothetical protein
MPGTWAVPLAPVRDSRLGRRFVNSMVAHLLSLFAQQMGSDAVPRAPVPR